MGLSARCVGSVIDPPPPDLQEKLLCGALCIVFDSESIGFAGALARVFARVCYRVRELNVHNYSGTSDKGPSEIGTSSLQRTLVSTTR